MARPPAPSKFLLTIQRLYDEVHAMLWALLVAGSVFFAVFTLPQIAKIQAETERKRIAEISAENRYYCDKWGMPSGSSRHQQCVADLNELRAKIMRRLAEEEF